MDQGPRSLTRPPKLQQHILILINNIREEMSERDMLNQTAKMLYQKEVDKLPLPRLQRKNPNLDMSPVWKRLANPVLGVHQKHGLFTLANGLVRNKEYIFMRWGQGDYTCDHNPDPDGRCAGKAQSVRHLFQGCARVAEAWDWMYAFITSLLPPATLMEVDCLTLLYPSLGDSQTEDTVTWLLGSYQVAMEEAIEKEKVMGEQELRGRLRQKYAAYCLKRMRPLKLNNL